MARELMISGAAINHFVNLIKTAEVSSVWVLSDNPLDKVYGSTYYRPRSLYTAATQYPFPT